MGNFAANPDVVAALREFARQAGGPDGPHNPRDDSPSFADGAAYAAHIWLHSVGHAHGQCDDRLLRAAIPLLCCRRTVVSFVTGLAHPMRESYGAWTPHTHPR